MDQRCLFAIPYADKKITAPFDIFHFFLLLTLYLCHYTQQVSGLQEQVSQELKFSHISSTRRHTNTNTLTQNALLLIVLKAWLAHAVIKYDIVSNH